MADQNNIKISGVLTENPSVEIHPSKTKYVKGILAVENKNETDYIPIKAFGRWAYFIEHTMKKGCLLSVSGMLKIDEFHMGGTKRLFPYVLVDFIHAGSKQ